MKIQVVGIGSCGCNTVNSICLRGVQGVSFSLVNRADMESYSAGVEKLCIGIDEEHLDVALQPLLADCPQTLIVVAGMGGRYSAKMAAVLCQLHKSVEGSKSIVFATMPFSFEARDKNAEEDLNLVSQYASRVVSFDNNSLRRFPDKSMAEAFRMVDDEVIKIINSVRQ